MDALQGIVTNPAYHDYLAILKGARNGFVYGVKVRFPHAVVMSILFGRGNWQTRVRNIYRATRQHAFNLAKFVTLYKTFLLIQRKTNRGKERNIDTFIAGLLGGYIVFGDRNAVNEQIVLYVVSRVISSFLPRAGSSNSPTGSPTKPLPPDSRYFTVFAALSWGAVMWLFRHRGETIQPGMFNSMTYLYRDSETWSNLKSLLWYNA
ncbi:hypothetical protein E4T56_gene13265 [Termitomyces sp. T112]|nr:hypothetical protein C0989_000930 [Termitomyces sp. Mn162]KAG5719324.1 hypothetical protein E4T56_gene13265 [Termitomyces sp. T112]KAH0590393.1 hypothetical protein H2248_000548 [Termitomyces sp. 'cryptogamus']KAH0590404.1 hypothetical protein H2248_000559 [Termitomyces sp. 'cryptogamus']